MTQNKTNQRNARIKETISILESLDFPKEQCNERTALGLLSLLNLKPNDSWDACTNSLVRGTHEMFDFIEKHYGKKYAENSRETMRKQTLDPFEHAGLISKNPDDPQRAKTSPKTSYKIQKDALFLLKNYDEKEIWKTELEKYKKLIPSLKEKYSKKRQLKLIPLKVKGKTIKISPGGQNPLIEEIWKSFGPTFSPGGELIYLGDAEKKWAVYNKEIFSKIGLENIDPHGKIPDVIIYDPKKNWTFLIEAVTSHGPIDGKRREELEKVFAGVKTDLIFVTAFPSRTYKNVPQYLKNIAWETEVWFADEPGHMIHYNGDKFLGPYK